MEKLVLRGILYGADKIPDSWFEKVPGGYYATKDKVEKSAKTKQEKEGQRQSRPRRPRRRSTDDLEHRHRKHENGRGGRRMSPHDYHYEDETNNDDQDRTRKPREHGSRRQEARRHRSYSEDRDSRRRDERSNRSGRSDHRLQTDSQRHVQPAENTQYSSSRAAPPRSDRYGPDSYVPPIQPPAISVDQPIDTGKVAQPLETSVMPPTNRYVPYAHLYGASPA